MKTTTIKIEGIGKLLRKVNKAARLASELQAVMEEINAFQLKSRATTK